MTTYCFKVSLLSLSLMLCCTFCRSDFVSNDPICKNIVGKGEFTDHDASSCFYVHSAPRLPKNSPLPCGIWAKAYLQHDIKNLRESLSTCCNKGLIGMKPGCRCLHGSDAGSNSTHSFFQFNVITPESNGEYVSSTTATEFHPTQRYKDNFDLAEGFRLSFEALFVALTDDYVAAYICRDNPMLHFKPKASSAIVLTSKRERNPRTVRKAIQELHNVNIFTNHLHQVDQKNCPPPPQGACKES